MATRSNSLAVACRRPGARLHRVATSGCCARWPGRIPPTLSLLPCAHGCQITSAAVTPTLAGAVLEDLSGCGWLSPVRPYDSPVTVATFLAQSLPLVLIAAVSPVLFLNASRVVESAGISAGLCFGGGAVLCLVALGIPTMGLMGAATSQLIAADLASRGVDLALALVLIAYGAWQVVRSRRDRTAAGASRRTKDEALPRGGRALFAAGLLGMLTNFTTLPLYLSVAQRIGTVAAPWWTRALLLVLVVVVVAAPVWLPVGLRAVAPKHSRIRPETRRRIQTATQRISIGACFVGGAVIIWHVLRG